MSHVDTSQLSSYNSLSDKHLAGYFANDRMRGHLRKSGLITRRGQIVSETSYRLNIARKEHKKHVKDLLAQAIVHKTLDLERHRQVAIRQKLEEIAKIELVQRVRENRNRHVVNEALLPLITPSPREKDSIPKRRTRSRSGGKGGRSDSPRSRGHRTPSPRSGQYDENDLLIEERTQRVRRSDEDILPFLSPRSSRPQSGPSPRPRRHRSAKYRPISAPSNMPDTNSTVYDSVEEDGDVTYVDDDGNTIDMSDCEQGVVRSGRSRTPRSREEVDTRHLYSLNPLALRRYANALAKVEQVNTLASPYLIPQIPIPPSSPRTGPSRHRSAGNRGRSTSSDKSPKRSPGVDLHRREPPMKHQGDVHSNCMVTMKFHGWALKLARERTDNRHDVTVEQQHCGGNTLTVFKGLIEPGSMFSFTSKRHRGYPFSLTLYVDGRQDARVSTCCEFGHSKKVRLGAKQGHFSFVGIKGMNPCYKCQVQKGLVGSKAPPKKVKRPPSNPGEEVIVVKTTEVPPKEIENAKQSDEEDSAHDQILIPVEVDGDEAPNNNADAYESDFEDEDDTPSGRSQQPEEDGDNKVQPGTPVDENDHPKHLPVLYSKDWDSLGKQQEAAEEPILEEQEEEDKRQIRGLADDFADDEKGDEKNAFVSAEKSANPDVVENFEDDTLRKVEGYSSEEEDLDGKKDKTIVVEKKLVSQNEDTVKPETVQVKETAASNRSPPPVKQIEPPGHEEDSSSESSFSSSSSSSSSPSENSTPREVAERKVGSPSKALEGISEADRTPSPIAKATVLSDRSDSYKSSTSSSSASDAESRPTSLPERPRSPVAETLFEEEKEEERKEKKIIEEKNKLSPSKKEEEEQRNEIPEEKSFVSKQTALPPLMDSARSEPESTATRGGESESVRESSSSSDDSSFYSESDSESDDSKTGPGKDRSPAQKTESQVDSKNVEDSSSSSRSASGSEVERSTRPITPFPTRKEKVSSKDLSDEESDKSSQDKYMGKPAMSPDPKDTADGTADSASDMQQNAGNAVVSEKQAVLSSAIVAAAAIMAPAVPQDMDSESLMAAADRSKKKDSPDDDEKKPADSGSSSVDSSSDSTASSSSSSEMESESEGELIVQEETPREQKDTSPQTGDSASRDDTTPKTVADATPAVVSTETSGDDGTKTEDSDSEEPQQTKLPAPHATPQPEQTTFPSPPRSPSKSHAAGQTEPVPPPVPTVVVIPTTPDIREGQGSGEWQDRAATPIQGPRETGGLPAQFEYQPKHSAESDDKTGEDGQTRRTSESEAENMHGGNDPDRVADDDAAKWQSVLEFVQPPPQTMHPGSLTPLLEDQNAIDINNINLTKAQVVEVMQTIETTDNLQAVTISNCSLGVDDMNKLLQSLAKSPSNPRILNLNNNILGPRSVVPLVEILKIKPSIDMLLLQGNPIGNEGLQTLVDGLLDIEFEAQEYKKRESERMGGVPVMSIKGRFCQLQELDLSETSITDDGMVDVALLLESNLDLHTLSLSSCPDITNPGWSKLASALTKNKNLKTLTIQNNKIGDEGVRILVEGLKNNTSLSTLEVANAGIEEAGGHALIDLLKRNTTVKYLTLRPGNDIPQKTQDEINRYLSLNQATPSPQR